VLETVLVAQSSAGSRAGQKATYKGHAKKWAIAIDEDNSEYSLSCTPAPPKGIQHPGIHKAVASLSYTI